MKGVLNENIIDALNLRPLDEVLKEQGIDVHGDVPNPEAMQEQIDDQISKSVETLHDLKNRMQMLEGTDHADAMDELHKEILQHARDLMSYGFNIDHPRARGIFEIAATMYSHTISAKNSKRDAQLKAMKLALDKRRIDLEEKRTNHMIGQIEGQTAIADDGVMVADRNEILRRMRDD